MYTLNYNASYPSGTRINFELRLDNKPVDKKLQDNTIKLFVNKFNTKGDKNV